MDLRSDIIGLRAKAISGLVSFMLVFMVAAKASAVPYELSYGGRLTEANGEPVSGPVNLRVTFFRSLTDSDQVAVAIPDFTGVALQEGVFQVTLKLSASDFHTIFNATDSVFIQIEDLSHNVTYPRQKFSAVPYALKVPVSGDSITYNANGELALGNGSNILTLPNTTGVANKVLKSDGAGALVWADDLTGGVGSITSTDIQDGTIVNADISAGAAIAVSKISGLGDAATKNVGTGAINVAAGDHSHTDATTTTSGFLNAADKVRLNAAVVATDTGTVTSTMIANGTISDTDVSGTAAIATSKLSGPVTSIASNGLGNAATKDVGAAAGTVAAGDHGHSNATTGAAGFMSAADKTKLDGIASGAGVDTNAKTLCADGEFLRGEDVTTCRGAAQIVGDGGGVKTSDTGTVSGTMIANGAIDLNKLSATICAANQVLKMNSGGTALTCANIVEGGGSYAAKSTDYTVTTSDNSKLLDVTNQTTITLPAAATAGAGFAVTVKNSGAALVRIMPDGTENIDGENVGVMLLPNYSSVTLISSGSDWRIASVGYNTFYGRTSTFADATCGGASDYCYDSTNAMMVGYAVTPGGKVLQYVLAKEGLKVWKQVGGDQILQADGSDNWQMKLNLDGKGRSATAFTVWQDLAGRVCPTNVYIDDSNKFTTGNCLYYTSEAAVAKLDGRGTSQTTAGSIGLNHWDSYNGGSAKWYVGNIELCSKKGMRLPTLYETTTTNTTTTNRPTSDGTPTYAQSTGVPELGQWTWTASANTSANYNYWNWSGTALGGNSFTNSYSVRCVVP